LDHSFERGLTQVSATYAQRADGGIDVLNRGFDPVKNAWRDAHGRAYFLQGHTSRALKSASSAFYGGYHVIALDPDYRYALIAALARILMDPRAISACRRRTNRVDSHARQLASMSTL